MTIIVMASLAIWLYLFFAHGRFWTSGPQLSPAVPQTLPAVDVIVPARDEAESIGPVISSLLLQRYAGHFKVILVDDGSSDDTAGIAKRTADTVLQGIREGCGEAPRLEVLEAQPKPAGWSGKLWALSQGVTQSRAPVLLLADADIVHAPEHLATLVARLESPAIDLVSEMVRLNCSSLAERFLVPAFVYFFQQLYPFRRVNDPRCRTAAAAGGTVLIRRMALERIGGIAAIKGALIDDVTLAGAVKRGGAIYLGHSGLATSIRRYPHFGDIWQMITRTAFTQLHYSVSWLAATVLGLLLVWWVPLVAAVWASGWVRLCGIAAFCLGALSFLPTLARYRRSPLWALTLPAIASFYLAATIGSAITHWRGTGARWKQRDYGTEC